MANDNQDKHHFSLLLIVGVSLAVLLCMLASATVYVAFNYAPLNKLLSEGNELGNLIGAPLGSGVKATPFQPAYTLNPQKTENSPTLTTPTALQKSTPTPTPDKETPSISISEPDLSNIPPSHYLTGIYGSPQYYTLDCEIQSAVDFARFFGVDIDREEFINKMPRSDDPEEGFVGDINGQMGQLPPSDYGVHAKPVAKLLRDYGLPVRAVSGWSLDHIRAEIAAGRPVIVWVVNLPYEIETQEYTASNGNTVQVARFEHTWIVTGYNMNTFTVVDSEWTYNVKVSTFKERWEVLGSQAIVYRGG